MAARSLPLAGLALCLTTLVGCGYGSRSYRVSPEQAHSAATQLFAAEGMRSETGQPPRLAVGYDRNGYKHIFRTAGNQSKTKVSFKLHPSNSDLKDQRWSQFESYLPKAPAKP